MKIIHHNAEKTVGIVTEVENPVHIGGFSPTLLKEWIKMMNEVLDMNGSDTIHLFMKKAPGGDCFVLLASADGEDPLVALSKDGKLFDSVGVAIASKHPSDGKKWGKVYGGAEKAK